MRHKHGYRKLGRTSAHRAALLKNLTISIINVGKIETTLPKEKERLPQEPKTIAIE